MTSHPQDPANPHRRQLLKMMAGTAALGSAGLSAADNSVIEKLFHTVEPTIPPGALRGAAFKFGHQLRTPPALTTSASKQNQTTTEKHQVIIVGGGIAGLSAAWWLKRSGFDDFVLLELESETGGNARSGNNAATAYPWGAHYLPLPGEDAVYVRLLLEELGVISGYSTDKLPIFDEYALCAAPHERLRVRGQWQESMVPQIGISDDDRSDYQAFFSEMDLFRNARGIDGKRAFTIPLALSSQDEGLLALDRISMAQYLDNKGWLSESLRWYVDYCCRDDYGAEASRVSAWAGIHYFASRNGRAANADEQTVLTWPAGNGWLAHQLINRLQGHIRTGQLTVRINENNDEIVVDCLNATTQIPTQLHARHVIVATPHFIARRIVPALDQQAWLPQYAPWLVANIALTEPPHTQHSAMAWDNALMESRSLGYIHAKQQSLENQIHDTVLTWYEPLDFSAPAAARQWALDAGHNILSQRVLADIERMHPDIRQNITSIDTWLWGHAMAIPEPDSLWNIKKRLALCKQLGNIHFAHSDMSGLSLFEEAQYHGVQAAIAVLEKKGLA